MILIIQCYYLVLICQTQNISQQVKTHIFFCLSGFVFPVLPPKTSKFQVAQPYFVKNYYVLNIFYIKLQ